MTPIAITALSHLSTFFTAAAPYIYRCDAFLSSSIVASPYVQVAVVTALAARYLYKKGYTKTALATVAYGIASAIRPTITPFVISKLTTLFNATSPYVYRFAATVGSTLLAHPLITAVVAIVFAAILHEECGKRILPAALTAGSVYSLASHLAPKITNLAIAKLTTLYHAASPYASSMAITLISAAAATPYVTAVAIVSLAALQVYKTEDIRDYEMTTFGVGCDRGTTDRLVKSAGMIQGLTFYREYGTGKYFRLSDYECDKHGNYLKS